MATVSDTHIECISDFCGNNKTPGHWADLWERPDGRRYITLGGGWTFFTENAPDSIDATSPHFAAFIVACESGEDIGYVREHF